MSPAFENKNSIRQRDCAYEPEHNYDSDNRKFDDYSELRTYRIRLWAEIVLDVLPERRHH